MRPIHLQLSGLYFLMIQVMNKCLDVSQRGQQKTRFSLDGILFMAITSKLSDKKRAEASLRLHTTYTTMYYYYYFYSLFIVL